VLHRLLSISSRFCAAFELSELCRFRFLDVLEDDWNSGIGLRATVIVNN
jgi:hypothetical protein